PVLANLARDMGLAGIHMTDGEGGVLGKSASHWVVLARRDKDLWPLRKLNRLRKAQSARWRDAQADLLKLVALPSPALSAQAAVLHGVLEEKLTGRGGRWLKLKPADSVGVWTDDYSNILSVFLPESVQKYSDDYEDEEGEGAAGK